MPWKDDGPGSAFERDAQLARRFIPAMKQILAEHLIVQATVEQDYREATDLVILRCDGLRIACRVRRYRHRLRYGHQFTLRTNRPSGARTELQKILNGWGDYLIYGFLDADDRQLDRWLLGDLDVFRRWYARCDSPPGEDEENPDGSSHFRAFRPDLISAPVTALRTDRFIRSAQGYSSTPVPHAVLIRRQQRWFAWGGANGPHWCIDIDDALRLCDTARLIVANADVQAVPTDVAVRLIDTDEPAWLIGSLPLPPPPDQQIVELDIARQVGAPRLPGV